MATDPQTVPDTTATLGDKASAPRATVQSLKEEAQNLAGTAKNAARNAAVTGKDRAAEALSEAAGFIETAAQTLDEKVGNGVGDYARKAGTAATSLADTLKAKDVDELVEDAKEVVRKNPALAVGAAAAVGFLLTRIFRVGGSDRA
jgi:ElaB/YqjD/DUF883 family membrane-anchored ribosome-binding protein